MASNPATYTAATGEPPSIDPSIRWTELQAGLPPIAIARRVGWRIVASPSSEYKYKYVQQIQHYLPITGCDILLAANVQVNKHQPVCGRKNSVVSCTLLVMAHTDDYYDYYCEPPTTGSYSKCQVRKPCVVLGLRLTLTD